MAFAKIFESEKYGQLCAIAASENDDASPEIRIYAKPEGLGVCSAAITFHDTEEGEQSRDEIFSDLTQVQAESLIKDAFEFAKNLTA